MIRTTRTGPVLRRAAVVLVGALAVLFAGSQLRPAFLLGGFSDPLTDPLRGDDVAMLGVPLTHSLWIPSDRPAAASATAQRPARREQRERPTRFETARRAFAQDLLRTGHVGASRAWRIADAAVRQAYALDIPPALVLGVMLTENTTLKPTARSSVGALGLMQIMPRLWRPVLGHRYGRNLRDDATNVRYGIYILRYMHDRVPGSLGPERSLRTALLRYNGCVRGKNTPNCHRYPDVVQRNVLRNAKASCGGRGFRECVVMPLYRSRWNGAGGVSQRVASAN